MPPGGKRLGAGRPRKPASERYSVVVNVRLTPSQFRGVRKIADERKIGVPDMLRALITKLVAHESTER
jgi:hypothetical protein